MKQSFQLAVKHFSPNVILFLGDLLDKGSQTAEEEYSSYKNRLDWVFDTGELKPLVKPLKTRFMLKNLIYYVYVGNKYSRRQ